MPNKYMDWIKNDEKRQVLLERRYELEQLMDGVDITEVDELKSLNREWEENELELSKL